MIARIDTSEMNHYNKSGSLSYGSSLPLGKLSRDHGSMMRMELIKSAPLLTDVHFAIITHRLMTEVAKRRRLSEIFHQSLTTASTVSATVLDSTNSVRSLLSHNPPV